MFDAIAHLISRMEPDAFMGLLIPPSAVVGVMIIGIVVLALKHLRFVREPALKQEMLARGMSPDDIERVLSARSSRGLQN